MTIENLGNLVANNYLLALPRNYMLVDTGYEDDYKRFCHEISKRNIDIKEISYIFLTHAHDDHAGFLNNLLLLNPNIKIILHQDAVIGLHRGQNSFDGGCSSVLAYAFCKVMALLGKGQHYFPIINKKFERNFILWNSQEAQKLEQELSMRFFETPGHSSCSISLLFDDVLFCGDAAMNGLPSLKRITIWVENRNDFYNSWNKIIALKPKMIYPGHGKPFLYTDLQKYLPHIKLIKRYPLLKK